MKNLTLSAINIIRIDNSRFSLAAAEIAPRLKMIESSRIVQQGALEIHVPAKYEVDFTGVDLSPDRTPFIVTKEIFDALPDDAINFVTPDIETATINGLGIPHVFRNFIAKPGFKASARDDMQK